MRFFGKSDRTPKMKPTDNFVIIVLIGIFAAGLDPALAVAQVDGGQGRGLGIRDWGLGSGQRAPSPIPQSPIPNPQSLLETAIVRLEGCGSISARTRQRAELFGKPLVGTGSYLERRTTESLMFRYELKLQLADKGATMLQVCDGPHLWIYQETREQGPRGQAERCGG